MTLSTAPTPSPPPPVSSSTATTAPASPEMLQAHSDDRWSRWATKTASRDFLGERRFQIIAAVIATGVIAWLIWTI